MAGSSKLTMKHMLDRLDPVFERATESERRSASLVYSLSDVIKAALAVFVFKYPSLLRFEREAREDPVVRANLRRLFDVSRVPCDETMRQRLDGMDSASLHRLFPTLFAQAQRAGVLRSFADENWPGHYVLAVDGTGLHRSRNVRCESCCVQRLSTGAEVFYHLMVLAALTGPGIEVALIPSAPEFVRNEEGASLNDCEMNATHRYLIRFRREHPHLKTIVTLDSMYACAPTIRLLEKLDLRYVIVAKEGRCPRAFQVFRSQSRGEFEDASESGRQRDRKVEYARRVPLTKDPDSPRVNMVATRETVPPRTRRDSPKESKWAFVTDLPLPDDDAERSRRNARSIAAIGRSRWNIENHVFKTLKESEGCNMKHNYGHGRRELWTVLALLMVLAFSLDQLQRLGSREFRAALAKLGGVRSRLWQSQLRKLMEFELTSWSMLHAMIAEPESFDRTVRPRGPPRPA